MRIFLTGFMGAGKSAVGRALADIRGVAYLDLDEEVERRAGMSVREVFERLGEPAFRDLEHECLRATEDHPRVVVATGGGTIAFERNLAALRRLGVSVWLKPSWETLMARLGDGDRRQRPLFGDEEQARELYRSRLDAYRTADLRVDVERKEKPREVATRIDLLLLERPCAT